MELGISSIEMNDIPRYKQLAEVSMSRYLLVLLLAVAHADFKVLQQIVHLLDLHIGAVHSLDHVLQLHDILISFSLT